jgi:hypothetical protein
LALPGTGRADPGHRVPQGQQCCPAGRGLHAVAPANVDIDLGTVLRAITTDVIALTCPFRGHGGKPEVAGSRTGVYKNMRRGIIALVFRCRIVGGEPHATKEVQEVAWLTPG